MDVLNFDAHNILLNDQPYPCKSIRPQYPQLSGDNTVTLFFPWWKEEELWRGDVTTLINGQTALPFVDINEFKDVFSAHFNCVKIYPIDYADLHALYNAGKLTAGTSYLIQDYATVWDQPDYYWSIPLSPLDNAKTGVNIISLSVDVEPLVVFATSSSTLSSNAYSVTHPEDEVIYDITFDETEITATPAFGRITRRLAMSGDNQGCSTPYDWRAVTFKRYQRYEQGTQLTGTVSLDTTGGADLTLTGVGTLFTSELSAGDILYFDEVNTVLGYSASFYKVKVSSVTDDTHLVLSIPDANYLYPSATAVNIYIASASGKFCMYAEEYPGQSEDNDFLNDLPTFDIGASNHVYIGDLAVSNFLLTNSIISGVAESVKTGEYFTNNTFLGDVLSTEFGHLYFNNLVLDFIEQSYFGVRNSGNIYGYVYLMVTQDDVSFNTFLNVEAITTSCFVVFNNFENVSNIIIGSMMLNSSVSDSHTITIGAIAGGITISDSHTITIDDVVENITISESNSVRIGSTAADITISESSTIIAGSNISNIEIIIGSEIVIGDIVSDVEIYIGLGIVIGSNSSDIFIVTGVNIVIGSKVSDTEISECDKVTIASNITSIIMDTSSDIVIGSNLSTITLSGITNAKYY